MKTPTPYSPEIEAYMKAHYLTLDERQKRSYIWTEALKLGWWRKQYIRKLFWCSINTLVKGISEVKSRKNESWRIRRLWGWDRKRIVKNPKIIESFDKVIKEYTAWSPVKEWINWTNLKPREIAKKMKEEDWIEVSVYIVNEILIIKKLWKRKLHKWETLKSVPWRNEQFENIKRLKEEATQKWNPTISVDTKKKGAVGEFH